MAVFGFRDFELRKFKYHGTLTDYCSCCTLVTLSFNRCSPYLSVNVLAVCLQKDKWYSVIPLRASYD